MRPLLSVLVWVVLVGGLGLYMQGRPSVVESEKFELQSARGAFALELTTTFSAEPDPFALQSEDGAKAPALLVKANGREVLSRTDRVSAGEVIRVDPLEGMTQGINEIYLEANPALKASDRSHAVRVRVLLDGNPIADRSFWSEPGSRIATTFPVETPQEPATRRHSHDH